MCQLDSATEQMFVKTIGEFIEDGRAFTGYDLTIRTREREKVRLRHSDVKGGIHELQTLKDLVDFDDWNKELSDLGNGLQAFLYFKDGYDKSQYQPFGSQNSTPLGISLNKSGDEDEDDQDDSGGQLSDGSFKTDYRNRLLIPTRFMKAAGLDPKTTVNMYGGSAVGRPNSLILSQTLPQNAHIAHSQIVERDGDVRVSIKTLSVVGGMSGNTFNIENDGSTVVITEA